MLPADLDALLARAGASGPGWSRPRRHPAGPGVWCLIATTPDAGAVASVVADLAEEPAVARAWSPDGRSVCWALTPAAAGRVLDEWRDAAPEPTDPIDPIDPTDPTAGAPFDAAGARLAPILLAHDRAARGVDSAAASPGRADETALVELATALTEHLDRRARGFARPAHLVSSLAEVADAYQRFWQGHRPDARVNAAVAGVLKPGLMHLGHRAPGRI